MKPTFSFLSLSLSLFLRVHVSLTLLWFALYISGEVFLQSGEPQQAYDHFKRSAELRPKVGHAKWMYLGIDLLPYTSEPLYDVRTL